MFRLRVAREHFVSLKKRVFVFNRFCSNERVEKGYNIIHREAGAVLYAPSAESVFFNPSMVTNRDMSIGMIDVYYEMLDQLTYNRKRIKKNFDSIKTSGLKIFDGFSASGIRSIRLSQEIPKQQIQLIHANDIDSNVVEIMEHNIKYNLSNDHVITAMCRDTIEYLNNKPKSYDIIDIDPYGSPTSMIDPSINAISEGGMLCITATDMLSLCGTFPTTSFVDYDAMSMNGECCHEMGLRILLGFIAKRACKMKRTIVPLLSVSVGHYQRLFLQVYYDASASSRTATKMAHVYRCNDCGSIEIEPLVKLVEVPNGGHWNIDGNNYKPHHASIKHTNICEHCNGPKKQYGPIWIDNIHDQGVSRELYKYFLKKSTKNSLTPLLGVISRELSTPLSYQISRYASQVKTSPPPFFSFASALIRKGFKVSRCHTDERSIKTDAPETILWSAMKSWAKQPSGTLSSNKDFNFTPLGQNNEQMASLIASGAFSMKSSIPGTKARGSK